MPSGFEFALGVWSGVGIILAFYLGLLIAAMLWPRLHEDKNT